MQDWTLATWGEAENEDFATVEKIANIKSRWKRAKDDVKDAQYIERLIAQDYIKTIRSFKTIWDYRLPSLEKAISEVNNKKKKERENISYVEKSIKDDFFNDFPELEIKIKQIITCGYEACARQLCFDIYGVTHIIQIPNRGSLTFENLSHAHEGRFVFLKQTSQHCTKVLLEDWTVEGLAEKIKEYINEEFGTSTIKV
jgi:hypothetical protein